MAFKRPLLVLLTTVYCLLTAKRCMSTSASTSPSVSLSMSTSASISPSASSSMSSSTPTSLSASSSMSTSTFTPTSANTRLSTSTPTSTSATTRLPTSSSASTTTSTSVPALITSLMSVTTSVSPILSISSSLRRLPSVTITPTTTLLTGIPSSSQILDPCAGVSCSSQGQCQKREGGFLCQCNFGYTGRLCEKEADECTNPNPCLNGGACKVSGNTFQCSCPQDYQGRRCDEDAPGKEIAVSVTITTIVFVDAYCDLQTPESQTLIIRLRSIFIPYCRARFALFVDIVIVRFFRGSLGVDFNMVFRPSSNVTNATVVEEFVNDNGTDQLQFLRLGKISAVEATPTTLPTSISTIPTEGTSKLETWIIVLIVAAVIVVLLLVIIIVLLSKVKYRRKIETGEETITSDGNWERNRANYNHGFYARQNTDNGVDARPNVEPRLL